MGGEPKRSSLGAAGNQARVRQARPTGPGSKRLLMEIGGKEADVDSILFWSFGLLVVIGASVLFSAPSRFLLGGC